MINIIKKHYPKIVITLAGGVAGFLYWKFIGCLTGTCPIKSVWYYSTLYGLLFGYLAGDIIFSITSKKRKIDTSGEDTEIQ